MAMASKTNTVFAYTVVYVKDVAKSTTFYSKAFGYDIRRLDDSNRYIHVFREIIFSHHFLFFSIVCQVPINCIYRGFVNNHEEI